MKKLLFLFVISLIIIANLKEEDYLLKDTIRFRVISNNDSVKDTLIKQKVSKRVSNIIFDKGKNKEDARNNIINNINKIEKEIKDVLKDNNYDKEFNVNYGYNYFPEKEYKGEILAPGNYESLVITIGQGKGKNYWCILYPPLCTIKDDNSVSNKIEYKFRFIEVIKNIF